MRIPLGAAKWEAEQYRPLTFLWTGQTQDLCTWLRITHSNFLLLLRQVALLKTAGHSDILEVSPAKLIGGMGMWTRKLRVAASNWLWTHNQITFPFWGSASSSITREGWTKFMACKFLNAMKPFLHKQNLCHWLKGIEARGTEAFEAQCWILGLDCPWFENTVVLGDN